MTPKYPTETSISGLVNKLNLPAPGPFTQDWQYEVANASRVNEFLAAYLQDARLTDDEKFTLMIVIIESLNDAMEQDLPIETNTWQQLKFIFDRDIHLHKNTLNYWASWEREDVDNLFPIALKIRELSK